MFVVIRFQICIFDILNTAIRDLQERFVGCDSLSNLYLWHIKYSKFSMPEWILSVVIRFQICIFDILNTAGYYSRRIINSCDSLSNLYLWHIKYSSSTWTHSSVIVVIRFQICIFDILNTATQFRKHLARCCDSLSNLYLWHIKYSQKYIVPECYKLWFAFKFVSLTY